MVAELDALAAEGPEVSYQALREMPKLEAAIKEALRLHPPLILLLRVAKVPVEVGGYTIQPGTMVAASPVGVEPRSAGLRRRRRRSTRRATSNPARTTSPTRGAGSRSAPAATAAWGPPSP